MTLNVSGNIKTSLIIWGIRMRFFVFILCICAFQFADESNQFCNEERESYQVLSENKQDLSLDAPEDFFSCEKIYISADHLFFNANSIYVTLPGGVIKTSTIFSDQRGLYLKDFKRQGQCPDGQWQCSDCNRCNENFYIWCRSCVYQR
ncbi:MAG: hypothetical protein NTZ52_04975 [Chlamydiae bacterium]|nr:hypothetical protein [Chlamydiota bacterium]